MKPDDPRAPLAHDLSKFRLPPGFRGAPAWKVQLWWCVQATLFRWSPQFLYPFRAALLRLFGAKVGYKVLLRPSVTVTYPWHVSIGDYAWIGDDVVLYSLGRITIGEHAVVSQKSYLCAGDHDMQDPAFAIRGTPINIGRAAWLAADVFVAPGVSIGAGTVVGARSTVLSDLDAGGFCAGSPCRLLRPRNLG